MGWNEGYRIMEKQVIGLYDAGLLTKEVLNIVMGPFCNSDIERLRRLSCSFSRLSTASQGFDTRPARALSFLNNPARNRLCMLKVEVLTWDFHKSAA